VSVRANQGKQGREGKEGTGDLQPSRRVWGMKLNGIVSYRIKPVMRSVRYPHNV
jgi:hypothetical protein